MVHDNGFSLDAISKPPAEAVFRRELKARRVQQVVGLLPGDARTGYVLLDVCDQCGELTGGNIMLACSRGDVLRWTCDCDAPQETTLGDEFPLAPIGSDATPVGGGHSR